MFFPHNWVFFKNILWPGLENQTASFLSQIPSHISTSKRKFSHLLNYSHLHFYYDLKNFPTYMIIPTCTFIKICIIFSPTCLFPPTLILGTQEYLRYWIMTSQMSFMYRYLWNFSTDVYYWDLRQMKKPSKFPRGIEPRPPARYASILPLS